MNSRSKMKTLIFYVVAMIFASVARAQTAAPKSPAPTADEPLMEVPDRDPAMVRAPEPENSAVKSTYPGAADEEELQVQSQLPEAPLKVDARTMQREVYHELYKQEMKEDQRESVQE